MPILRALITTCLIFALSSGSVCATPAEAPSSKTAARSRKSTAQARRLRQIHRAFMVASDLKVMAAHLLQSRTAAAYSGVEAYAARHQKDEAGPLAWLVLGYAHSLDSDYARASSALQRAKDLSPELQDYLDYFRAAALQGQHEDRQVVQLLENFEQKYPESVLLHDAAIVYAGALTNTGSGQQAVAYLEKRRQPARPDTELALARAYNAAGNREKATEIFRRLYFESPLTAEADNAASELKSAGEAQPQGSFDARLARANVLLKGKRYQDAVSEFSQLEAQAPPAAADNLAVEYAAALYRDHKHDAAQHIFDRLAHSATAATEIKAQSLYFLAELAREKGSDERRTQLIAELRNVAPQSPWFQDALFSAGNGALLKKDYEGAVRLYSETYLRDSKGKYAAIAHWKAAWLTYRLGKRDDARRLFEEQLESYPASGDVPAALYWRGRLAEEAKDEPLARACYQKLSENFRYFYYANLARARLGKIGFENIGDAPFLAKLPRPSLPPQSWDPPADNLRAHKAELLANAALYDFAVRELQAAANGSPAWLAGAIAQMYYDGGNYKLSIETIKRAVPGYFSAELSRLPRPVWQSLFPHAFWDDLKKNSESNSLDPYLVASLIRQESEFSPVAISPARAMGLMQLLPKVGRGLARQEKIRSFSTDSLLRPEVNLRLGTRYFKQMVDRYNGQVEYALAAYNAGKERVDDWRSGAQFNDIEEFVESIPFTETREYVQAILRNAVLYKLLYPKG